MRLDGSARFMRLFERDDAPRVWVLSIISPLSLILRRGVDSKISSNMVDVV